MESFHDPYGNVTWAISYIFKHSGKMHLGNRDAFSCGATVNFQVFIT